MPGASRAPRHWESALSKSWGKHSYLEVHTHECPRQHRRSPEGHCPDPRRAAWSRSKGCRCAGYGCCARAAQRVGERSPQRRRRPRREAALGCDGIPRQGGIHRQGPHRLDHYRGRLALRYRARRRRTGGQLRPPPGCRGLGTRRGAGADGLQPRLTALGTDRTAACRHLRIQGRH